MPRNVKSSGFRVSVAAVLLGATLSPSAQAAGSPCWSTREATAQRVLELQTMLNVAGLQCRYDPTLKVLDNYNQFIRNVRPQFLSQLKVLETRFKRTGGRSWQNALDKHRTKLFNSYSTVNDQVPFCLKSAEILLQASVLPAGELSKFADRTMALTNFQLNNCPVTAAAAVNAKAR